MHWLLKFFGFNYNLNLKIFIVNEILKDFIMLLQNACLQRDKSTLIYLQSSQRIKDSLPHLSTVRWDWCRFSFQLPFHNCPSFMLPEGGRLQTSRKPKKEQGRTKKKGVRHSKFCYKNWESEQLFSL